MTKNTQKPTWNTIPTVLTEEAFNEFILPHLQVPSRGPSPKLSDHAIFNYILNFMHTGCQWENLSIKSNRDCLPEIHYTRIYSKFRYWVATGSFDKIFENTVRVLNKRQCLDLSIIHGDGTTTTAKKGGDNLGFNGHKHMKGDKTVAFCDRNCNIIAPFIAAAGNRNECPLLPEAFKPLKAISKAVGLELKGAVMSLDGIYDSKTNRKIIFNHGMTPNIPENKRNRKTTKRGRKRVYSAQIFKERFYTIERIFAWEDKFKRLLLRFERLSHVHYGLKTIAYSMINLRHFCA
jgi:transposase